LTERRRANFEKNYRDAFARSQESHL